MIFLGMMYFQYIQIGFKPFGESVGHEDIQLTYAYMIAQSLNCFARLTSGIVLEIMSFKVFFSIILSVSLVSSITYPLVGTSALGFTVLLCLCFMLAGAI